MELPEPVPEEWYWQSVPGGATSAADASGAGSAGGGAHTLGAVGPDTPAGSGGLLSASLAAGSLGAGAGGPLADIATASLWLGDGDVGDGAAADATAAAVEASAAPAAAEQQEWSDAAVEISYQVVPKPPGRGTLAGAPTEPQPPTGGAKPAVSSLTAAVAAAEASCRHQHAASAAEAAAKVCSDSEDSWASSSDDEYSGSSGSEGEGGGAAAAAAQRTQVPHPGIPAYPLRRISSSASMGSAGSSGSGSGSSSGSGRMSSPPAPIPGRSQQQGEATSDAPWQNSYDEGGRLAAVADAADGALAAGGDDGSPQRPRHCRGSSGSGDEEPSFRDSWLSEEQQQGSGAEDRQRTRVEAAVGEPGAATVELCPHRRGARPGGGRATSAARPARQAAPHTAAKRAQPAQQRATTDGLPASQKKRQAGHYWDVVRSVEKDVQSRLAAGSATASSAAGSQTAAASPAATDAHGESSGEEFVPAVPRQRRPLGSAQLSAAQRRHEEAAAVRAAEAAALEMAAEAADAEDNTAALADGLARSVAAAAAQGPADGSGAAAAAAAAAEQQRQWSEFWMQVGRRRADAWVQAAIARVSWPGLPTGPLICARHAFRFSQQPITSAGS